MTAGSLDPEPHAAELTALLSAGLTKNRLQQEEESVVQSDSRPGATHTHTYKIMTTVS